MDRKWAKECMPRLLEVYESLGVYIRDIACVCIMQDHIRWDFDCHWRLLRGECLVWSLDAAAGIGWEFRKSRGSNKEHLGLPVACWAFVTSFAMSLCLSVHWTDRIEPMCAHAPPLNECHIQISWHAWQKYERAFRLPSENFVRIKHSKDYLQKKVRFVNC